MAIDNLQRSPIVKADLSESDICDRYITPAIERAGWANHQWRREFSFTDGPIIVRGKLVARGKRKWVDYLLFYKAGELHGATCPSLERPRANVKISDLQQEGISVLDSSRRS